ncbi:hypothetical protein UY286_05260 [Paenibacillus polymyxa]|uniref:hypothetical protein n=1 Tax=Paenibacillus polymyxa TaxID=1406 RepID=UPI002AB4FD5E|nr:hypothetical protein [Paenibacillus polymyxa]MDY7989796.1 hypothetical protein [Paenibacillus polymyxa]MDY8116845.1 hypothetical protein [Paenibacillus polymyxa]
MKLILNFTITIFVSSLFIFSGCSTNSHQIGNDSTSFERTDQSETATPIDPNEGLSTEKINSSVIHKSSANELSIEEQEQYILEKVEPSLNEALDNFLSIWEDSAAPAIVGMVDNSVNFNDGHEMLKSAYSQYKDLQTTQLPSEGLSKENFDKVQAINLEFIGAVELRLKSLDIMLEMYERNEFWHENLKQSKKLLVESNTKIAKSISLLEQLIDYKNE